MRINVGFREQEQTFGGFQESDQTIDANFGSVRTITENDYNRLVNKPSINSIVLEGPMNARDLGLANLYYDTKENWDRQLDLVAEQAAVYVYSNADYIDDGNGNLIPIAGIKIGDGTSYLIDMPFVSESVLKIILAHVSDLSVHVTEAEKEFWNNSTRK